MKKKIQLLIIVCMSSILYSCKMQSYTFAQIFEATAQNNNSSIVREDNGLLYSHITQNKVRRPNRKKRGRYESNIRKK